jgi:hypothetical protein
VVSQKVLEEYQPKLFSGLVMRKLNSPLEGQIKVDEKDTESIPDLVGRTGILGRHSGQAGRRDDNSDKADNVHGTPGVDFVMEPGA